MGASTRGGSSQTAQHRVAASRVRFLTGEDADEVAVRGPILESWKRSHAFRVDADRIEMPYEPDLPLDTRLSRSAAPVLRALFERLQGQAVSVVLTDPTGLVLTRLTTDSALERHLDRVYLAPGFSYAEQAVGTNGIGTALEVNGPAHVFGHEHYAEHLEDLACAGVPIHHPISGRLVGAVDLTCWGRDAAGVMTTLAQTTADQIRQALLADVSAPHVGLLQEYLRACARNPGIVLALNSELVMVNDLARTVLAPADQDALLLRATEALARDQDGLAEVELPSARVARMYCRVVERDSRAPGLVARVRLDVPAGVHREPRPASTRIPLPGLVGSAPAWLHACEQLETAFRAGEWVAVEGEPGVGKLALLNAVQLRRQPVGRFSVHDAADAGTRAWVNGLREALEAGGGSVVVRHVDRLSPARLRTLEAVLARARDAAAAPVRGPAADRPVWVAITLTGERERSEALERVLALFPGTVEVPPLRLHLEDLPALVPVFLARLGHRRLTCSPETMRLLMRMSWPGNVAQLHETLRKVVSHRRAGTVEPGDLPPEVHSLSRRLLTPLESLERDAIVTALADAGGNKVRAATALGMSRATIYRKISDYGIVAPSA